MAHRGQPQHRVPMCMHRDCQNTVLMLETDTNRSIELPWWPNAHNVLATPYAFISFATVWHGRHCVPLSWLLSGEGVMQCTHTVSYQGSRSACHACMQCTRCIVQVRTAARSLTHVIIRARLPLVEQTPAPHTHARTPAHLPCCPGLQHTTINFPRDYRCPSCPC